MLISEAATLKYLRAYSCVPVPEVYAFDGSSENDIGIPFFLMSKAPGRALSEFDWHEISQQTPGYSSLRRLLPLSNQQREKIMIQLGTIMAHLSALHFDKIGSLFEDNGSFRVGECLSPALVWQWRDSLDGIDRGPFSQEQTYLDSLISAFICHSEELSLTPHAFFAPIPHFSEYTSWTSYTRAVSRWNDFMAIGSKIEQSDNRLAFCIAGQLLREMIPKFVTKDTYFTLSHPDLHLGNIFVDEDFNITCIIDWGSASSGPPTELLATPGLGGGASPPPDFLSAAFRSGFRQISQLALDYREKADAMWYFSRLVRMQSTQDYMLFQALHSLVYKGVSEKVDIPTLSQNQAAQEDNRQLLITLREDDLSDEDLQRNEKAAFSARPSENDNLAVARKLTVNSQMSRCFIADKRLWHWIEGALEQD